MLEISSEILAQKGIRPSYQRLKILEYLRLHTGHPTVEEIFNYLSPDIPSLSKATVYNTLHTFSETGVVRTVHIDGDEMRYDIILSNHGHFKCDVCGRITNFAIDIDRVPTGDLARFKIKDKNVYFNGICPDCQNQPQER
jgi:Fur family transcriptional regulator, peroxide stress response regulator